MALTGIDDIYSLPTILDAVRFLVAYLVSGAELSVIAAKTLARGMRRWTTEFVYRLKY